MVLRNQKIENLTFKNLETRIYEIIYGLNHELWYCSSILVRSPDTEFYSGVLDPRILEN